jgi:hypothetical protein
MAFLWAAVSCKLKKVTDGSQLLTCSIIKVISWSTKQLLASQEVFTEFLVFL